MRRRRRSHIHHTHYNLTPKSNPKPHPLTPTLVDEWVRVLIEEGIEPNPGPTFITKNINGISDIRYWQKVLLEVKQEHLNIPIKAIFLQEHHLKEVAPARAIAEEHGFYLFAVPLHPRIHRGGTAILIPRNQIETLNSNESHHEALARVKSTMRALPNGRGIACDTLVEGKMRRLASVYAPSAPNERTAFFRTLPTIVNSNTILGIDANCVPDVTLDRTSSAPSPYDNTGANTLNDIIAHLGLIDVARESLGNEPFFTCFHGQSKTRIDRIYAPDEDGLIWAHSPVISNIFPRPPEAVRLDHEAARISLKLDTRKAGNEIRHIDERIYDSPSFVSELATIVKSALASHTNNWGDTWNNIKTQVKKKSLAQTMLTKSKRTQESKQLRLKIAALKATIDQGAATPEDTRLYLQFQQEYSSKRDHFKSPLSTPETTAYAKGKKHDVGSAAFFRPFKPKDTYRWIANVFTADWTDPSNPIRSGDHATEPNTIAAAFTPFYQSLFRAKETTRQSMDICLDTLRNGKKVLPPTATKCGASVSADELRDTMDLLPTGKSAGPDAIPNKFYKVFSSTLAPILANVFQEAHERGTLPPGVGDGYISLLYKKKERDDPRNYRPITLLNSDYKILMRVLARRMNEAVVQFVSDSQTGFVPDSFLPENTMLLQLLMDWVEEENEEAYLVFLDMEKAFDRCSWTFLIEGLEAIGFDQNFIDFVKLAYSNTSPPKRKIVANGYLGPEFTLHSGVAQGCPLSPLLFLIITEPLSRLIHQSNRHIRHNPRLTTINHIRGILVDGVRHRITQFADDSTLIQTVGDARETDTCLEIWQEATAMRENQTKREGLLIGALRHNRHNAPTGVVHENKWTPDGTPVRALGHPLGYFNHKEWWLGRYRTVKARFGLWPCLRRLSLKGRNLILQSMFFGSFRFWLYAMEIPDEISQYLELDAKNILWSSNPKITTNELGSAQTRPYIAKKSAYRPETKGGAGTIHWPSHCKAFYAEWIIRLLHPRQAPWKQVFRSWYPDWNNLGDGLMTASAGDRRKLLDYIPAHAHYIRRCVVEFNQLKLTQNLDLKDNTILAEPLWLNPRFTIPLPDTRLAIWLHEQELTHVANLFDPATDRIHSLRNWYRYFRTHSPNQRPAIMRGDLDNILQHLPHDLERTCAIPPPSQIPNERYVALVQHNNTARYATIHHTPLGTHYEELYLDKHRRPHLTGQQLTPSPYEDVLQVELWDDTPTIPKPDYGSSILNEIWVRLTHKPFSIMGPITATYPRNIGWHPYDMKKSAGAPPCPLKFSDLTIRILTKHITSQGVRSAFPNCAKAWHLRYPRRICSFRTIFTSFGTRLSDATEERQWRKYVHRATNVRNRNPDLPDHTCRLCRRAEESMQHLVECQDATPYWKACITFTNNILKAPRPNDPRLAITFGQWRRSDDPNPLGPEDARAFLRHAFNHFYHDFANVEMKKIPFVWQSAYLRTLLSFREAIRRRGHSFAVLYANRIHTQLPTAPPVEERELLPNCMKCSPDGTFTVNPAIDAETERAKAAVNARHVNR